MIFFFGPHFLSPIFFFLPSMQQGQLEKHAELVKTISDFDLQDIGERVSYLANDLGHVKNILVTGGAGFM